MQDDVVDAMLNGLVGGPADPAAKHVQRFCEELVPGGVPIVVSSIPAPGAPYNECVTLVDQAVVARGGARVDGWALWDHGIFIEAEYHCLWQQPNGELVDLSPPADGIPIRTFLRSPHLLYCGRQLNNIRRALIDAPAVHRLIQAHDDYFEIMNRGERAGQHGLIHIPEEELRPVMNRKFAAEMDVLSLLKEGQGRDILMGMAAALAENGRNQPCPCGSGLKYKKCHGRVPPI